MSNQSIAFCIAFTVTFIGGVSAGVLFFREIVAVLKCAEENDANHN